MYFIANYFFAGQIIYDMGGLCRIAPQNFANLLTTVQSDVRGGSNMPCARPTTQAWIERTPQFAFNSATPIEKLAHGAQLPPNPGLAPRTQWTQVLQKRLR